MNDLSVALAGLLIFIVAMEVVTWIEVALVKWSSGFSPRAESRHGKVAASIIMRGVRVGITIPLAVSWYTATSLVAFGYIALIAAIVQLTAVGVYTFIVRTHIAEDNLATAWNLNTAATCIGVGVALFVHKGLTTLPF